ncbi:MAG: hypothetical protein B9J98_05650 [Candidatus Terraquivivens tikiterensis]|uniref:Uncharacterized protein n=1 Tax=Candidatus Terraquivivens tikiterensis TaxID=1980982 RepID=A0A2R7Y2C1_9ARCH|nr:MAG: hypothetical protein B9J98_05650 [Candidatus Terraquivivens tikiterensis]
MLSQLHELVEVNTLFRESHELAVNLQVHALRSALKSGDPIAVHEEVSGEYGRFDVLIKSIEGSFCPN